MEVVQSVKERNRQFEDSLNEWKQTGSTKAWDTMWIRVYDFCLNYSKKKCQGIYNPHLEERAMDATIDYMYLIKRGVNIMPMTTGCHYTVVKALYNDRVKKADRELQLSKVMEEYDNESVTDNDD